jgi:uncharacterized protein YndB with AHSA1/START domain
MTDRSVIHDTFTIEHTYDATPSKVFAAFASRDAKKHWFGGGDEHEPNSTLELDFRVGGRETTGGGPPAGPVYKYEAIYQDIIADRRIVYTYNMWMDEALISVSVATVQLEPSGSSTKLIYFEHGAYLDGLDKPADRAHGTREMLVKSLPGYLKGKVAV